MSNEDIELTVNFQTSILNTMIKIAFGQHVNRSATWFLNASLDFVNKSCKMEQDCETTHTLPNGDLIKIIKIHKANKP